MGFFAPLNPRQTDWRGKRVWIVGASSGIGQATAATLHALGAVVIVSARQQDALQAFAAAHPGSQALALDATDRQAVQAAADSVLAQGRLDCVLYCAGYYQAMRGFAIDIPQALRHMEVNYDGALYLLQALLPQLLAQGSGHISLVGSVAGYRGLPNSLAYGPSKAALISKIRPGGCVIRMRVTPVARRHRLQARPTATTEAFALAGKKNKYPQPRNSLNPDTLDERRNTTPCCSLRDRGFQSFPVRQGQHSRQDCCSHRYSCYESRGSEDPTANSFR